MDPYSVVFRNLKSVELQRHSAIKFPLSQLLNYHIKKKKKLIWIKLGKIFSDLMKILKLCL